MPHLPSLLAALAVATAGCAPDAVAPQVPVRGTAVFEMKSTIAFASTRDDPLANPLLAAEIYLMDGDGTRPRRLTANAWGDAFPALSPDGRRIVFDSNRLRADGEPLNTSALFVMDADPDTEGDEAALVRGSSATWAPDGQHVAFHASASGAGAPIKPDPGAATIDSDIFILSVDEQIEGASVPRNLTNDPLSVDDDPDWSPDGSTIVFTSHSISDNHQNSITAEIYVIPADGSGARQQLTSNAEEERAPSWSPDGQKILYMCRNGGTDFEICVMGADGSNPVALTANGVPDLTPSWSPDGTRIVFHRPVSGRFQLFVMNPDGSGLAQLTSTGGINAFANWGEVRANVRALTGGEP